ncbi:helix-hairpin-helix domain-containing protein [candidate division WOR-3 bacterium]|nr:helix-hairpin-helix domain-containing protein [candidate division WOR-3 bacterium]
MLIVIVLCSIIDEAHLFEYDGVRDIEIIARDIEQLKSAPIPINSASREMLQMIPFLSFLECQRIIEERTHGGVFRNRDDLERIPGFDVLMIDRILPYITFTEKRVFHEQTAVRLRATTMLPWSRYREEVFGRTLCRVAPYTFYGVGEKDEYEKHYLDYWAAGLVAQYDACTFALGKYNLDLGTGVMLSPIGSFYSTTDFHYILRERGIIPYTSVNENSGFFGAAVTDSLLLKFTLFYSNQRLDGRIDTLGFARSFDACGDHVDSTSLDHKDRINEECAGYALGYASGPLRIAQRTYWCRYDPSFACVDSFSRFYGSTFFMSGLQVAYTGSSSGLVAEVARGAKDKYGGLCGIGGALPYLDVALIARYFPIGYYSPKGVEAESGSRGGILVLKNRSKIALLTAEIDMDSDAGKDTVLYSVRMTAEKKIRFIQLKLQMRWQYQESALDLAGSRIFLRLQASKGLWADIRLEERYVFIDSMIDQGLYVCLELGSRYKGITMRMRYGMFSTESYDARMYIYEIDLPGVVNNRMVYGKGSYAFIYGTFKVSRLFGFSTKYTMVWKENVIEHELGCQIDWTLP